LKEILRQTQTDFKENEGDIKSLYNSAAESLNLNPKGEHLESHLRTILQGLKSLVVDSMKWQIKQVIGTRGNTIRHRTMRSWQ